MDLYILDAMKDYSSFSKWELISDQVFTNDYFVLF